MLRGVAMTMVGAVVEAALTRSTSSPATEFSDRDELEYKAAKVQQSV